MAEDGPQEQPTALEGWRGVRARAASPFTLATKGLWPQV